MNIKAIKSEILEIIDKIEDEKLIEVYRDILLNLLKIGDSTVIGYAVNGDALNADLLKKEVIEAQARIKSGKYIAHEDMKNID
ncbi:MAG: hypothetical protein AB8E82_08765 [Aureispira sp.]